MEGVTKQTNEIYQETKKKRYWFRGGIISLVGTFILTFIAMVLYEGFIGYILMMITTPIKLIMDVIPDGILNILGWPIYISYLFGLGAIIGWIYGKIKSRKQTPANFPIKNYI